MVAGDVVALQVDRSLVALSYLVSALGSYVAIECARRARSADPRTRRLNIAAASCALGGIAIWAMHFVGMVAYRAPLDVRYDVVLTVLSLAAAVAGSACAIWFLSHPPDSRAQVAAGGFCLGIGVAAMFHIGMAALHTGAHLVWNPWLVAASVTVAVCGSMLALGIAWSRRPLRRVMGALALATAVCAANYLGMAAGTLVYDNLSSARGWLDGDALPYYVFFVAIFILGAAYILSILGTPDARITRHADH